MSFKLNKLKIIIFFRRALIVPLIGFLRQGLTPKKLALTLAVGLVLGVIPVIGVTTILCALAAFIFRLNMPAIQLINYFVAPVQLIVLIPFVRIGEYLFGEPSLPLDVFQIIGMIQSDFFGAVTFLWLATIHGVVAWILIGLPMIIILYFLFVPILQRLVSQSTVAE